MSKQQKHQQRNHSPTTFVDEVPGRETIERETIFFPESQETVRRSVNCLLMRLPRARFQTKTNRFEAHVDDIIRRSDQPRLNSLSNDSFLLRLQRYRHTIPPFLFSPIRTAEATERRGHTFAVSG